MAVRGAMRLCLVKIASMASGMPWPRMSGAHLAMALMTSAPVTAAAKSGQPGWSLASERFSVVSSWNKATFVSSRMRCTRTQAAPPPATPRRAAIPASRTSRLRGVCTIIVAR